MTKSSALLCGCCVEIKGIGVLLLGKSGVGKTQCVLSLLSRGYKFVADDVVRLQRRGSKLLAGSDSRTASLVHVRGVGIVDMKKVWGEKKIKAESEVRIAVEIVTVRQKNPLPKIVKKYFLGVGVPHYSITGFPFADPSDVVEILALREKVTK